MITRLLELELSGFRCFSNNEKIPLDADVVLIYGPNGTGKTSILSALEFGLTGQVYQLSAFQNDYPRCLRNVTTKGPCYAKVRFQDTEGIVTNCEHTFDGHHINITQKLSTDDQRFFHERCYLSQTSLNRLLENYQACSKEDPEQPLIRFVRELLGLDLLENLTSGLYEASDLRRIEKSVPTYAKIKTEEKELVARISELRKESAVRREAWQEAQASLQDIVKEYGDPLPNAAWTPEGVLLRAEAHSKKKPDFVDSLNRHRQVEGKLQRARCVIDVSGLVAPSETSQVQLDNVLTQMAILELNASPIITRAEEIFSKFNQRFVSPKDLAVKLESIATEIRTILTHRQIEEDALAQASAELDRLHERQAELTKELAEIESSTREQITNAQRWATLLGSILEHLHGEDCPVCGRDFSEVSHGHLRTHITDKMAQISAEARQLEESARRREILVAEQANLAPRLAAFADRVKTDQALAVPRRELETELKDIAAKVNELAPLRIEWAKLRTDAATIRSQLETANAQRYQRDQAVEEVKQIVSTLPLLPRDMPREDPLIFTNLAIDYVQNRAKQLEQQTMGDSQLCASLAKAKDIVIALQEANQKLEKYTLQHTTVKESLARMENAILTARELSKAATRAKTKILEQVFNDKLNRLWGDLFRRLVRHEQFQPRLREPTTVRGQIRTSIEAFLKGVDSFEQFASIASSGNLNTAALSLFLSMHLVVQPRHRLLVLDDPVQNMDDLHIVQFANLLRGIRRQENRQIVIAVHERELFEYLCLELGPTEAHPDLLTIEMECLDSDRNFTIKSTSHKWNPATVRFASVA